MANRRPLKLWIASAAIFGVWAFMFSSLVSRQTAGAGEVIDLRTIAKLKPPAEWQFTVLEQAGESIGYSWTHVQEKDVEGKTRYAITERSKLRNPSGGEIADTALVYEATVDDRFRLLDFSGALRLGAVEYRVRGTVEGRVLRLTLEGTEGEQTQATPLNDDLYLPLTALPYLATVRFEVGKTYTLKAFNPLTSGAQDVRVRVLGREPRDFLGKATMTTKLELSLAGVVTHLFVDDVGNRVREETPDGGIVARAATQEETFRVDRSLGIPMPSFRPR